MKRIYLLRHGHAEQELSDDKGRKLSSKGKQQVEVVAAKFQRQNLDRPSYVLSSSSVRTHQTAEAFLLKLEMGDIEVHYQDELYHAREHKIIQALEKLPNEFNTVLYVGHNPGIEQAVSSLTEDFVAMGTATMVCLDFNVDDWALITSTPPQNVIVLTPD